MIRPNNLSDKELDLNNKAFQRLVEKEKKLEAIKWTKFEKDGAWIEYPHANGGADYLECVEFASIMKKLDKAGYKFFKFEKASESFKRKYYNSTKNANRNSVVIGYFDYNGFEIPVLFNEGKIAYRISFSLHGKNSRNPEDGKRFEKLKKLGGVEKLIKDFEDAAGITLYAF